MLRRRNQSFGNYVTDILRNSMVTGLPQIARTANPAKKLIRALVLIACLTGFIYQSLDFMNLYWQYKTITDVNVEATNEMEEPSFTLCNLNGIYRSRICNDSRFMSNCTKFEDSNWCKCSDGRWCKNGTLEDPKVAGEELIKRISSMEYEEYNMLLQKLGEFIKYCNSTDGVECDLEHSQHTRCSSRFGDVIESCWTFNTVIGRPEIKPIMSPHTNENVLIVLPHIEEYPAYCKTATVYISIHNARQIINPFYYGFPMEANTIQEFRLKKVVKKLLPAPYETNCVDYIEIWKSRGGYGPTNQKECFEECEKNLSMQVRGCVHRDYGIPGYEKYCSFSELKVKEPIKEIAECQKENCFPACYEEHFEVTREIIDRDVFYHGCPRKPAPEQDIKMLIAKDRMETITYAKIPKFQNVEAFSNIGGYVGIWLGISLVAVFDFLETVILIISYPFKRYKKARVRNGKLEKIKKLSRDL